VHVGARLAGRVFLRAHVRGLQIAGDRGVLRHIPASSPRSRCCCAERSTTRAACPNQHRRQLPTSTNSPIALAGKTVIVLAGAPLRAPNAATSRSWHTPAVSMPCTIARRPAEALAGGMLAATSTRASPLDSTENQRSRAVLARLVESRGSGHSALVVGTGVAGPHASAIRRDRSSPEAVTDRAARRAPHSASRPRPDLIGRTIAFIFSPAPNSLALRRHLDAPTSVVSRRRRPG